MANENIQELKFQVGEVWKGIYSSSTPYGLANVVQDPTGLSVYRSLKSGNVGHPVSDRTWWFCIIDMSSIKAESDRIAALNQAIAQDEALRVAAEELRQQHEVQRISAETQRNEAEQARISAEQARVNAESARATAEQQRITAEQGRVSAESARVQAEQARVLSETLRANAEDQRAANEQNRIAAEQQRIERAEQDHQRAESDHATYVDSLGAFDISSYHATDGVLAKYADLTAALGTNGANIPDDLRKGGMSVKFVQSSDNKYVQYRYMGTSTAAADFTNTANWQLVIGNNDLAKDNIQSKIVVESGRYSSIDVGQPLEKYADATRARFIVPVKPPFYIKLKDGYSIRTIILLDNNFDVTSYYSSGGKNELEINNNIGYVCCVFQKTDESAFAETDIIEKGYFLVDYSLKSDIVAVTKDSDTATNILSKLKLEYGALDTGVETIANNRLRTKGYLQAPFSVDCNQGYRIRNYWRYTIDENRNIVYVDYNSIEDPSVSIEDIGYIYRLVFDKSNGQDFTEAEMSQVVNAYTSPFDVLFASAEATKENGIELNGLTTKMEGADELGLSSVEPGAIDSSTGQNIDNNTRARTKGFLTAPFKILVSSGYVLRGLHRYTRNADGTISYVGYIGGRVTEVRDTTYIYRLLFNKTDDTQTITDVEAKTIVQRFINSTEYVKSIALKDANLKLDIQGAMNLGLELELGVIDSSGQNADNNTRARSKGFVTAPFSIKTNDGFYVRNFYRYVLNNDGTVTFVDYITDAKMFRDCIDTRYVYRLVFNKTDDTEIITSAELDDIIQKFNNSTEFIKDKCFERDSAEYLKKLSGKSSNVSAHYGGNLLADYNAESGVNELVFPEYSQYTLILGKRAGFDIIGMNLKLTKDNKVVCLHDNTLNRTFRNASDYSVISDDVNVASLTLAEIKAGYVNNTEIERLRLPILTFEDAIITAKNLNVGIVCLCDQFCFPYAWELLKKYDIRYSGLLLSQRPYGYDGLVIAAEVGKQTKEHILQLLDGIGKPACYMIDQTLGYENDYTDAELIEIADAVHSKGYLLASSLWAKKGQFNRLRQIGAFDFSNVDNEIPAFANGDVINVKSVEDFSDFTCSTQVVQNSGKMNVNDTISYAASNYPKMSGVCLKIHFKGELQLIFGNRYAEADNVIINSDGGVYSIFTNVFYNVAPTFTIKATAATDVYDIDFAVNRII